MNRHRPWMGAILAGALACTPPAGYSASNPCADDPGGIGGTGVLLPTIGDNAALDPGGMGGTGIVGIITGFASICVLGIEIHYDASTRIKAETSVASATRLAIGQVVAIDAVNVGGRVTARSIVPLYEVSGPVLSTDLAKKRIAVMGQKIDVSGLSGIEDAGGTRHSLSQIRSGEFVRVSGMRRPDGTVAASRLVRVKTSTASVFGRLRRPSDGSAPTIAGIRVRLPRAANASDGAQVQASGKWSGTELMVAKIGDSPVSTLFASATRVELQGYAQAGSLPNSVEIWGQTLKLDEHTQYAGAAGFLGQDNKVRISARVTVDGQLIVERVIVENPNHGHARRGGAKSTDNAAAASGQSQEGATTVGSDPTQALDPESAKNTKETGVAGGGNDSSVEKTEKVKPEGATVEKAERASAPEKPQKTDVVDRPEKVDKPEKIDRPAKPDRPEKVDRFEKPQRPERR